MTLCWSCNMQCDWRFHLWQWNHQHFVDKWRLSGGRYWCYEYFCGSVTLACGIILQYIVLNRLLYNQITVLWWFIFYRLCFGVLSKEIRPKTIFPLAKFDIAFAVAVTTTYQPDLTRNYYFGIREITKAKNRFVGKIIGDSLTVYIKLLY